MLHNRWQSLESKCHAPVLLTLLNLLQNRDKMVIRPRILYPFLNLSNKFTKTLALMLDPLFVITSAVFKHICAYVSDSWREQDSQYGGE